VKPANAVPLVVVPLTVKAAGKWVHAVHVHLPEPRGALFASGVEAEGRLVCAGMVGRPSSRVLDTGDTAEVTRVACDRIPNAASMLLGSLRGAALALGYGRVISYTLLGESGRSYRAAGWWPVAVSEGGEWARAGRKRDAAEQAGRKVRWETGPRAMPRDEAVEALVREWEGKVEHETRPVGPVPVWRRGPQGYSAAQFPRVSSSSSSASSSSSSQGAACGCKHASDAEGLPLFRRVSA